MPEEKPIKKLEMHFYLPSNYHEQNKTFSFGISGQMLLDKFRWLFRKCIKQTKSQI